MRLPAFRSLGVVALASLTLGALCSTEPDPPTLSVSAGATQNVYLGSAVAVAPAVKLVDAKGAAVAGSAVTFAIATGGGTVTAAAAATNAEGIATVGSWTPGTLGSNTLTATAEG